MKTSRSLTLCGLLVSTAAYAQPSTANDPPVDPPVDPAPAPVEPVPPPPPVVEVKPQPTTVVVAPAPDGEVPERYRNAGLLFNLNNVFVAPGVLGGWQGFGFGAQKTLDSGSSIRVGLELARQTDPVNVVKTTRTNGMDIVTSYDLQLPASGFTGQHAVAVVLDWVKPLTTRNIAPYMGPGVFAGYSRGTLSYTDDLTVTDQVTEIDNTSQSYTVGVRGIFGVNWRINERFSLFAEYHLAISIVEWQSDTTSTTTNNTAIANPGMEAASSRVETELRETRWLNLDTGLGQGGSLGLVAHF